MSTPTIDFGFHTDPGSTHAVAFATKDQMVRQIGELVFISTFTLSTFTCIICVFPQFSPIKRKFIKNILCEFPHLYAMNHYPHRLYIVLL